MDRTFGSNPPVLTAEDAAGGADPFKERLERGGRKRSDRRDPRIQAPSQSPFAGTASPAALDIVRGPLTSSPRPDGFLVRASGGEASDRGVSATPIIPPGEVYADPELTELVQEGEAAYGLPSSRAAKGSAAVAPAAIAPMFVAKPVSQGLSVGGGTGQAGAGSRTSVKAFASNVPDAPQKRRKSAVAAPDDRQDDIATGAIAALVLLLAGWMGLQSLGSARAPGPVVAPEPDAGPLLSVQSAPAPAPVLADPYAGAPVDLTPSSAAPNVDNEAMVFTPATAALDMPMSPMAFSGFSVMSAAALAVAPASEAAPAVPVSCDPNLVVRTYFCTAQTNLTVSARAMLERELANLKACASGREIVVTGFADTRGLATRNAALSEGRADSVAQFLRGQGLAVVTVAGAGEVAGLENDRNCAHQRRVDISFKGSGPANPSLACAPPSAAAALACG